MTADGDADKFKATGSEMLSMCPVFRHFVSTLGVNDVPELVPAYESLMALFDVLDILASHPRTYGEAKALYTNFQKKTHVVAQACVARCDACA